MARLVNRLFGKGSKPSDRPAAADDDRRVTGFERPLEERYVQALLTNTFGQTYYASQKELISQGERLHDEMLEADPAFMARALVYARNKGFMRTQPIYGMSTLAVSEKGGAALDEAFGRVILTPNDLGDFTTLVKSRGHGEGGRRVKRVAGNWLLANLSEYWAIKYGAQRAEGYSIADMFKVYHPKAGKRLPIVDYVLGKDADLASLPQIAAFERLKRADRDEDKIKAITAGRLPHEVATPFAGSSKGVWQAIVPNMPVMALLKNLATLERHEVLESSKDIVLKKLTERESIEKSRILPFRFVEARQHVRTPWLQAALANALDLAFANVPDIPGRTAVFLDRSGSMSGTIRTAAIFGVCLMKKARNNGRFMLFDDQLEEVEVDLKAPVLQQAERIHARGGTTTSLPMEQLTRDRDKVDNVVLITDEQQNQGSPFHNVLDDYRRKVNPEAKCFVIDLSPYQNALVPATDDKTFFVYGWSDQALSFVSMASQGWGTFVDVVRHGSL